MDCALDTAESCIAYADRNICITVHVVISISRFCSRFAFVAVPCSFCFLYPQIYSRNVRSRGWPPQAAPASIPGPLQHARPQDLLSLLGRRLGRCSADLHRPCRGQFWLCDLLCLVSRLSTWLWLVLTSPVWCCLCSRLLVFCLSTSWDRSVCTLELALHGHGASSP